MVAGEFQVATYSVTYSAVCSFFAAAYGGN